MANSSMFSLPMLTAPAADVFLEADVLPTLSSVTVNELEVGT